MAAQGADASDAVVGFAKGAEGPAPEVFDEVEAEKCEKRDLRM
jgi:hypothetical protein